MKKKLLGIFVCTLLIATALPAVGMNINVRDSNDVTLVSTDGNYDVTPAPPFWWLIGADQKQTEHDGYGFQIRLPFLCAQEFKPTKNELTAVALEMFKFGNPPAGLEITVSIRDSLNGSDLTVTSVDADQAKIKGSGTWVLFDFQDITVTPENTYYIVCSGGGGDITNAYAWLFGGDNKYDRGIAYSSDDEGVTWHDLEDWGGWKEVDFCFITYWQKPRNRAVNTPFLNFLENHPNLFPILRHLLGF